MVKSLQPRPPGTYGRKGSNSEHFVAKPSVSLRRYMASHNQVFHLMQQQDGNLVLYGPANSVLWSAGTYHTNVYGMSIRETRMQSDGNLVVYNSSAPGAAAVWASNTVGAGPSPELVLQNDGNLVLRSWSTWQVFWQTGTGGQI